ncbi:MAG: NAD-dependent epimerase/dehydratase family protein [Candidatus Pacebacteria bacterium]|nr:NAD-dependent epimerase/dehydratase family protein [Candidatus Paceibacterota bacterium]
MLDKKQTILITGGTGFAGSHLVEALLELGYSNIHVTAFRDQAGFLNDLLGNEHIHALDLTDHEQTKALLNKLQPQQIYHLASLANVGNSFKQQQFILETHLKLQLNILDAVKECCPKARLLSVGSALEYQDSDQKLDENAPLGPTNPYALSKMIQDFLSYSYSQSEKLDIVRVRPFNHIGERQALGFAVSDFAHEIVQIERGQSEVMKVGNLSTIRDLTDVKDVVRAYILLMNQGVSAEVYNVGSGIGYSMQEVLDKLIALAKVDIKLETDPALLRPSDRPILICDNKKIKNLAWDTQYSLDATLERVLNWWRKQADQSEER